MKQEITNAETFMHFVYSQIQRITLDRFRDKIEFTTVINNWNHNSQKELDLEEPKKLPIHQQGFRFKGESKYAIQYAISSSAEVRLVPGTDPLTTIATIEWGVEKSITLPKKNPDSINNLDKLFYPECILGYVSIDDTIRIDTYNLGGTINPVGEIFLLLEKEYSKANCHEIFILPDSRITEIKKSKTEYPPDKTNQVISIDTTQDPMEHAIIKLLSIYNPKLLDQLKNT